MTPIVSFDQAKKKCIYSESVKKNLGFLSSIFGQNGGSISKELKNASKILSKK
jgi:ABC-type enterochelin transport system substrate-binding protein